MIDISRPSTIDKPQIISLIVSGNAASYLNNKLNKSKYIRDLIQLDMDGGMSTRIRMLEQHRKSCIGANRREKIGYWSRRIENFDGHGFKTVDEAIDWMDGRA